MKTFQFFLKRSFDIVVSFFGIIVCMPLGILIALVIKGMTGGPVLYSQVRIGKNGVPFRCSKFCTMVPDAEKYGTVTAGNDMRITKPGKFLRRFKLDEFPQLWNVFTGKMSFVGPRPDVPGYADTLQGEDRVILELRPGITGPASIFFRFEEELLAAAENTVSYNDTVIWPTKVRLNKHYYERLSLWRDIAYILITVLPSTNLLFKLLPSPPRSIVELESTLKKQNALII